MYFAARDPRTPWYARVVATAVVAYALSPFDLIPDFVPVLGYLDDLIIVPLGILLVVRMIPKDLMEEFRAEAAGRAARPQSNAGIFIIFALWLLLGGWAASFFWPLLSDVAENPPFN